VLTRLDHVASHIVNVHNRRGSIGKSSLTISAKPGGVGAACQRLIQKDERSGLLTHIKTKVSGSLCVGDEKLTAFVEPESGDSELPQIVLTS
jgi:hypothetical protein